MKDMSEGFWTGLIKELLTDLYGETLIQSETGLQGDRGVNVEKSALFNEKIVTDFTFCLADSYFGIHNDFSLKYK